MILVRDSVTLDSMAVYSNFSSRLPLQFNSVWGPPERGRGHNSMLCRIGAGWSCLTDSETLAWPYSSFVTQDGRTGRDGALAEVVWGRA